MKNNMEQKFSNFCCTCIMDRDFKVLWTDQRILSRRLSMGSKKLLRRLKKLPPGESFEHIYRSEGISYRAIIDFVPNGTYICRVSREISQEEIGKNEICEYIDNIRHSSLNIHAMVKMLEHYASSSPYLSDVFHNEFRTQRLESESICSDCHNLLEIFDNNFNNEFIPLTRYILRTWDIMQFATRKMHIPFSFNIDIIFPCVRIDYSKFELALYNLTKIVLIYSDRSTVPLIKIKTVNMKNIEVSVDFPYFPSSEFSKCDLEIRAIKHIFRQMGGHFEIHDDGRNISAFGTVEAEFSCNEDDIEPGNNIICIANQDIIERRKNSDKYLHIYKSADKVDNYQFASNITELSDVEDEEIVFAEMFFSKVFLLES